MRIIDPHVHVWKNDPAFPWAQETRNPPTEDRTPEMLVDLMRANGVEKTVLVQVIHYRWDNSYVAQVIKKYPKYFMGVGRVNPEDPAAPDHLEQWTNEHGLHGVRLSPSAAAAGDWFCGPMMGPLFARAERLGVPMLILTGANRLTDLVPLVEKHPALDVVIDHMASVAPDDVEGRRRLLSLARFPRLYVKISHTWSLSQEGYPWKDAHDLVRALYHTFGARRVMWATDWPVCLGRAEYAQTLSVVRDEMDFIGAADLEWVLGKTALQIWPFSEQ